MIYKFRKYAIPERMMAPIRAYVEEGRPFEPGGFLEALVCHKDVFIVVGRADDQNLDNLPAFCGYFHNEVTSECHGSWEKYQAWLKKFEKPEEDP